MSLHELLGVDREEPIQQLARYLVESDRNYVKTLVEIRKSRGLSIDDVAYRVGIDAEAVEYFERHGIGHLSAIRRYALAIGAKVDYTVTAIDEWE